MAYTHGGVYNNEPKKDIFDLRQFKKYDVDWYEICDTSDGGYS